MNKYNFKRIFPLLLFVLAIIFIVVGFSFAVKANLGAFILFFLLGGIIGFVAIYLSQKNKREIEEAEIQKKFLSQLKLKKIIMLKK